MSVLNRLASSLGRLDEIPNQELAKQLVESGNREDIQELVDNLRNSNKSIQSDCIKVLYEIGESNPEFIAPYVDEFVALLSSTNNRLVWGGMTALGLIVKDRAEEVWKHIDIILNTTEVGSAITKDWGIRVLVALSAHDQTYEKRVFPFLTTFLENCPAKDLPRHAESCLIAIHKENRTPLLELLESRMPSLKPSQAKRVMKVIRQMKAL